MQNENRNIYIIIFLVFIILIGIIFYFESRRLSSEDMEATVDARVGIVLTDSDFDSTNEARLTQAVENFGVTSQAQVDDSRQSIASTNEAQSTQAAESFHITAEAQRPIILTNVALAYPSDTPTSTDTPTNTPTSIPTNTFTPTNTPTNTATATSSSQNVESSGFIIGSIDFISREFAISPDGSEIVGADHNNELFIFNLATVQARSLGQALGSVTAIDWSPDGQYIAVADMNKNLIIWDVNIQEEVYSYSSSIIINELIWSPDNEYLGAIGRNRLFVWSRPAFLLPLSRGVSISSINESFSWLSFQGVIAVAAGDAVRLFRVDGQNSNLVVPDTRGAIFVTWSPSGSLFATADDDEKIYIQRSGMGRIEHTLSGHRDDILYISWSPNSRYIASASEDETVRVWDVETGELLYILNHRITVSSVKWSPDGSYLASSALGVTLWDLPIDAAPED